MSLSSWGTTWKSHLFSYVPEPPPSQFPGHPPKAQAVSSFTCPKVGSLPSKQGRGIPAVEKVRREERPSGDALSLQNTEDPRKPCLPLLPHLLNSPPEHWLTHSQPAPSSQWTWATLDPLSHSNWPTPTSIGSLCFMGSSSEKPSGTPTPPLLFSLCELFLHCTGVWLTSASCSLL